MLHVDASVYILNGREVEKVRLQEFLELPSILDFKGVLFKVKIPSCTAISSDDTKLLFESYRPTPRSIGKGLTYVNDACFALVSRQESSRKGKTLDKCFLAFGSHGSDHSIRATLIFSTYLDELVLDP